MESAEKRSADAVAGVDRKLAGVLKRLDGSDADAARKLDEVRAAQAELAERLAELEALTATLRHDVRGALSPAMLVADRLIDSGEPATKRAAEIVIASIERVEQRLADTREQRLADDRRRSGAKLP